MVDVKEVLRRWQQGQSARQIARDGVADRKTATRYIDAAVDCGVSKQTELVEAIVLQVAQRVQNRTAVDPSEAWRTLETHRERIKTWLRAEQPLRLVRVHELLGRQGVIVSYTTLRRFAHQELAWKGATAHSPRRRPAAR